MISEVSVRRGPGRPPCSTPLWSSGHVLGLRAAKQPMDEGQYTGSEYKIAMSNENVYHYGNDDVPYG